MADKPWSKNIGEHGTTVVVWEREFGGTLYLRWYVERKTRKKSLGFSLRNSRGRIIEERKKKAIRAAMDQHAELVGGTPDVPAEDPEELTLRRAFELFFRIPDGYFATDTRDYRERKRAARDIQEILGPDTLWTEVVEGQPEKTIWRALANRYSDGLERDAEAAGKRGQKKKRRGGPRWTVRVVDTLFVLGTWLNETKRMSAITRPRRWQANLKREWAHITGREHRVERLRFTADEIVKLDAHRSELDPRADLLFDVSFAQRAGQVLRLVRSRVHLECNDDHPWGYVDVEGRGRKRAGPSYLTESQFRHLERELREGYLADFERRYQAGELEDYVMFPGGLLIGGEANPAYAARPANRTWARDQFLKLERLAGVPHVHKRGWHGVRRKAADLAEDFTEDDRVLRSEGNWTNDDTRRGYQEEERPEILRKAAEIRAQVRGEGAASSNDGRDSDQGTARPVVEGPEDLIKFLRQAGENPAEVLRAALAALDEEPK